MVLLTGLAGPAEGGELVLHFESPFEREGGGAKTACWTGAVVDYLCAHYTVTIRSVPIGDCASTPYGEGPFCYLMSWTGGGSSGPVTGYGGAAIYPGPWIDYCGWDGVASHSCETPLVWEHARGPANACLPVVTEAYTAYHDAAHGWRQRVTGQVCSSN